MKFKSMAMRPCIIWIQPDIEAPLPTGLQIHAGLLAIPPSQGPSLCLRTSECPIPFASVALPYVSPLHLTEYLVFFGLLQGDFSYPMLLHPVRCGHNFLEDKDVVVNHPH